MIVNVNSLIVRILNLSPILYLLLNFFRFLNVDLFYSLTSILILYGCLLLAILIYYRLMTKVEIFFILSLFLFSIIQLFVMRNNTFSMAAQFFANFFFGISFFYSSFNKRVFAGLFLCMFFYFMFSYIVVGVQAEDVFIVSRNYISIIALLSISLYFISCRFDLKNIGKLPCVISFLMVLINFWAIGRSGIAISLLIFIFLLFSYVMKRYILLLFLLAITVLFILLVPSNIEIVSNFGNSISFFQVGLERFQRLGGGGQRSYINAEYIELVFSNLKNLFFGIDLSNVRSIVEVDGNPHNSFINLHITFGFFGVLLFIIISMLTLYRSILQANYLLLMVFFLSLFRVSVDIAAFNGPLDAIIVYCLFYSIRYSNINNRRLTNA